jgi:2-amino-4-hydroxy-6-hydroxymethyldihydropteridine diphosphokinase
MIDTATTLYISLGSNIEPGANIASARDALFTALGNACMSPVYQSPAVGMTGPDFYNAVVSGTTTQSLPDSIALLQQIETTHGRVRTSNKFIDRTLDLDLLLYGDQVCSPATYGNDNHTPDNIPGEIVLPHPEILQQAYVLQPLADVAGDLKHPESGITIAEHCIRLKMESPELFAALKQLS